MPTINGKWKWNGYVENTFITAAGNEVVWSINFTSAGEKFDRLNLSLNAIMGFSMSYNDTPVQITEMIFPDPTDSSRYENVTTFDEKYRIIDFGEGQEIELILYDFIVSNARPYGEVIADMLETIAVNEQRVFDAGKKAEHDAFWDGILSGNNWQTKFCGSSWNDKTFYPNQDIKPSGFANNLFSQCEITDLVGRLNECGVMLDTSGITHRGDYMFNYCTKITTVPYLDLRNSSVQYSTLNAMFSNCYELKTIEGIHLKEDGTQKTGNGSFNECRKLENITFYGAIGDSLDFRYCTKLTKASIESIVNALSDDATGKTLTLSRAAVDEAFRYISGMYNEQGVWEEIINIKGSECWMWEELIATKSNWEFTLV